MNSQFLSQRLPRRHVLTAGAALLAGASLPLRAKTLDAAQITETVYPSGLRLIVKENHASPMAAIQVWIRAGGFLEDEKTAGTAHAIEHLLFRSGDRSAASIDTEVENLGGLLEARTEKDWTEIGCTVAGKHAGKVLTVLGDTLRKPLFRADDLAAEKPVLLEETRGVVFEPAGLPTLEAFRLGFKKHPYRYDVRGTPGFIGGLSIEAVRAYYQKHYVPAAMTVVVVGDVDPAGVERMVRLVFPSEGKPATLSLPPAETPIAAPQRVELPSLLPFGSVMLAYPSAAVTDRPGVYATDVLVTMLENGQGGRLPRLLKQVANVSVSYQTRRQAGLVTVLSQCRPEDLERIEALLRKELEFVAKGDISAAELNNAKRALRGNYALESETYAGQASTLGFYAAIDRWQFAAEYPAHVDAVTADDVRAVAAATLTAERCIAVTTTPRGAQPRRPQQDGT